ncbi:hypothetical protein SAMN04488077_105221 [Roseovarius tolerans]|uniref:Uncharacterized protein n=1 Tax=Roseovarius tolerans TaxID=74031 RepID=A0A1H7Z7I7_9RHOB|nr:hypothetical protein [Roseovarius tolerans]SEM54143.1 hypothetical protein SAMN04488077_105221 [Roseovarius tolerans]
MSRCLALAVLLSLCLSGPALPGAWPREKGTAFLSLSRQAEGPDDHGIYRQNFTLYAEYGLTERLTLGVDAGGDALRMTKAIGFLRWPLGRADRGVKLAFELGAGQVDGENALRPGLSLGRGVEFGKLQGWLAADGRAILFTGGGMTLETDLTFGLSLTKRSKVILQIQAGQPDLGGAYTRFAPSFVFETKPGAHIEFGLTEPLLGDGDRGIKMGLWRKF